MSGGFFRGTSADQDTRFSNKQAKLLKTQKFAQELDHLVDMTKVKMDVMKPWIAKRVTELLGFEDEVLINFVYGLLDAKEVDGKQIQIQLTGFMEKNTGKFMKELWVLLLSAQKNASGVPQQFLDEKEEEMKKKMVESERITQEIQKRREREGQDAIQMNLKGMDGEADITRHMDAASTALLKHSGGRPSTANPEDERETDRRRISRRTSRQRSPSYHSDGKSPFPQKGSHAVTKSRSRSFSRSRSYSDDGRKSRDASLSASPPRHLHSQDRRRRSLPRYSVSPHRHRSPQVPASRRRSPYARRRSSPRLHHRSPSPFRRRSPVRVRRRSPSPRLRRPSPIRRRSRSPPRRRSPPRSHRQSPSRRHHRSPSPSWRKSPIHRRSPVKLRRRSPSPANHKSPSRRISLSPMKHNSPSPLKRSPQPRSPKHRRISLRHSPRQRAADSQSSPRQMNRSHNTNQSRSSSQSHSSSSREQSNRPGVEVGRTILKRSPKRSIEKESKQFDLRRGRLDSPTVRQDMKSAPTETHGKNSGSPPRGQQMNTSGNSSSKSPDRQGRGLIASHDSPESRGGSSDGNATDPPEGFTEEVSLLDEEVEYGPGKMDGNLSPNLIGQERSSSKKVARDYSSPGRRPTKEQDFAKNSHLDEALRNDDRKRPRVEENDRICPVDTDSEDKSRAQKTERRPKKSDQKETSLEDESDYDSATERRKELKRRKREERRLRKEEKRRRREERHRKREERRAQKMSKDVHTVGSHPDKERNYSAAEESDKEAGLKFSITTDTEERETDQKKLEIELRKKALESLRAKKAINH